MSVNNSPVCAAISAFGTTEQKERFLRPLARGALIGAFALTEPQAGSDAANLKTRAPARRQPLRPLGHQAVHHLGQRSPASPSPSP